MSAPTSEELLGLPLASEGDFETCCFTDDSEARCGKPAHVVYVSLPYRKSVKLTPVCLECDPTPYGKPDRDMTFFPYTLDEIRVLLVMRS